MSVWKWSAAMVVGCAMAATAACNSSTDARRDADVTTADERTAQTNVERHDATPITVAGCLQRGDGSDFILTRVNQPMDSVGTSGGDARRPQAGAAGAAAGQVEREQLREAAGAYRVNPSGEVKLEGLVGKEVRVVGTIRDDMDLPRANASQDRVDIKEGDLTRITAESVSTLAEVCQGAESPAGTRPAAERR